jgi:uncharacterized protein (DUF1778 family)
MPDRVQTKGITIRFGQTTWRIIRREAALEGTSLSQFVREAAMMRAMYLMQVRGELDFSEQESVRAGVRDHLAAERAGD